MISEEEINMEMQNIDSLKDLIQYFVEREKEEPRFQRNVLAAGRKIANRVDKILES